MEFWKMNGAGNDFIIVDGRVVKRSMKEWAKIARVLCERHLSLGADGFIVIEEAESDRDFKMLFFNSDGSLGEMCGNGARCLCRYAYEKGLSGEIQKIESTAGLISGKRVDKRNYQVLLNLPTFIERDMNVDVNGKTYEVSYVELGNPGLPHVVVNIEGLQNADEDELRHMGRELRYYKGFPKGANVNFYEFIGEDKIYEVTYERGVENFTYACGTGTACVAVSLYLRGKLKSNQMKAFMRGGELKICLEAQAEEITKLILEGSTNIVAKGQIFDEELFVNTKE